MNVFQRNSVHRSEDSTKTTLKMDITHFATLMIFSAVVSAKKFDADYCEDYSKCQNLTMEHLLCKFKHESSKGDCTNIRGRMTPDERMHILAFHNWHRNELGTDPAWAKYPSTMEDAYSIGEADKYLKYARSEPSNWLEGFAGALCIRQLSWSYENEKAAQIWAEQCAGDEETYNCITDFKERFPQFMSVYTMDGTVDGEELMRKAFEHWRATNGSMKGDRKQPGPDKYEHKVYDENKLGDFTFDEKTEFLPWASMSYWKTFLLGCGKAHFSKGGKEKTRIVCVYGPGINYIAELKVKGAENGPALYVIPDNITHRQCVWGGPADPEAALELYGPGYYYYNACPFYICACAAGHTGANILDLGVSTWPWLCTNDCQAKDIRPGPIPGVMDYIRGAAAGLSCPGSPLLVLGVTGYVQL